MKLEMSALELVGRRSPGQRNAGFAGGIAVDSWVLPGAGFRRDHTIDSVIDHQLAVVLA